MPMDDSDATTFVCETMMAFAERTGLTGGRSPRRYLWTDAFAVCNLLELEHRTGDGSYRELALRLVDQVHHVLGRHRADDPRQGWISGLGEDEGERHPTRGGLRIGKPLPERGPDEPMDERFEWDRDGQYFHYLTKWMHALARVGSVTGETRYLRWALELAETAYERFSDAAGSAAPTRMVWKMSIDLSGTLVDAQGQHDSLDGLVTFLAVRNAAAAPGGVDAPDLDRAIRGLAILCEGQPLATADPLGIGGLLTTAHTLTRLTLDGLIGHEDLLLGLLDAAATGLRHYAVDGSDLSLPADYRLAFRELGLSLGLRAVEHLRALAARTPSALDSMQALRARLERLMRYHPLIDTIEGFWTEPANRRSATWREHEDINTVMLATSLAPGGFLAL